MKHSVSIKCGLLRRTKVDISLIMMFTNWQEDIRQSARPSLTLVSFREWAEATCLELMVTDDIDVRKIHLVAVESIHYLLIDLKEIKCMRSNKYVVKETLLAARRNINHFM